MYNKLVIFRNELKNKHIYNYKIIGIVSEIILSKDIIKRNSDINNFTNYVFDFELKPYILKSRILVISHLTRFIIKSENNLSYKNLLYNYIDDLIEDNKKTK